MASSVETLGVAMMAAGAYLVWFAVHYWRDQAVVWPTTPIKSLLTGGDIPSPVETEPVEEIYQQQLASTQGLYTSIGAAAIPQTWSSSSTGGTTATLVSSTTPTGGGGSTGSADGTPTSTSGITSGTETQNAVTIGKYLLANGYSTNGTGGILACIYWESGFDPEYIQPNQPAASTGGGIIQWTPIDAHPNYITGNADVDMQTQLVAMLEYNNSQGASTVAQLNAQSSITAAADFYSQNFEFPSEGVDADVQPSGIAAAEAALATIQGGG